ncbi:hypothetical protein Sjap_024571 [Stephania japonica]|uniref:Uncharacterized protein n=1 Tax=Stephania japonica TaxID=461633 RepID=A0AAP0HLM1_9MAGN
MNNASARSFPRGEDAEESRDFLAALEQLSHGAFEAALVCSYVSHAVEKKMYGVLGALLHVNRISGLAIRVRSAELEAVVTCCPCLEELDLSYCCGVGDQEASTLSGAKGLQDLKLVKC